LRSKLPDVGTTIFTVMSRRAAELGAINLGQGFPDYPIDPLLAELVHQAMLDGHNQYAPMPGLPLLTEQIALKLKRCYGISVDPASEITVTLGATEGIYSAVQALAGAGDEVVVFDPCYDSYDPAVRLAGARCVHVPLQPPHFRPDWDQVRSVLNDRTRVVMINSPQNPACSCLSAADLDQLAVLLRERDSVAVFSFGKTLHATGIRVGYAVAPALLTTELRKVHQFNTFTIATSLQQAIGQYLKARPECGGDLAGYFQGKRDLLSAELAGSGFQVLRSAGSYFQLVDYSQLADGGDSAMAERLLTEAGVATIPLSVFYQQAPPMRLLRLCFAKRAETLQEGAKRLREWASRSAG
jgi:methionine transaminase